MGQHTIIDSELAQLFSLRSARSKRRLMIKDRDKGLLKLSRRQNKIYQEIRALGYEDVNPPYQQGWKRFFVLRDDTARSKQAEFFTGLLEKINTVQYSHRKDFKVKRRRWGRKIYVDKPQYLMRLHHSLMNKLNLTEKEQLCFYLVTEYNTTRKCWVSAYQFIEPWRYQLKVAPNMITRLKRISRDLELEKTSIQHHLERNCLRPRLNKLLHGRKRCGLKLQYQRAKENPFRNQSLATILDEHCYQVFDNE